MSTIAQQYPLQWPAGWKRSTHRSDSKFRMGTPGMRGPEGAQRWHDAERVSLAEGLERVRRELRAFKVPESAIVISSDLRIRQDGQPYADQAWSRVDPGVAVYWRIKGATRCMAIDRYTRLPDNMAAIAATLDAMRAIERHGGATILDRAFTGFLALAAPEAQNLPHQVLGVAETATRAEIEYAYRRLAQQLHPDAGGSHDAMSRLNVARDAMLAALP